MKEIKNKTIPLNEKDKKRIVEIDNSICELDKIHDEIRVLYIEQRKVYLDNPFWGFGELITLFESKLIKMKQSTTAEKRISELKDIIVYCEMAIAFKKYYDRKKEYPIIHEP